MSDEYPGVPESLRAELIIERDLAINARLADRPLIEPTEEERQNGWTAEALTEYVTKQEAAESLAFDKTSLHARMARRPRTQARYNPHRWRG